MTDWTNWRRTVELLTPADMGRADAAAIAGGTPGMTLMERAGAAVADEAARLALPLSRATPCVAALCGPGNNGGDGYVAARLLAARGFQVQAFALCDRAALKGDAAKASDLYRWPVRPIADYAPESFDLVIDGLFGAGLARDLDGEALSAARRTNEWRSRGGGRVVAIDVPSGLDGATGHVRGAAFEADSTVTFFRLKPGHVLISGRLLCGDLRLAQIGIFDSVMGEVAPAAFLNGPELWRGVFPALQVGGHKYTRGHVAVVSGPEFHTGAARLSACAAARVGAGLVTIAGPARALAQHAAHVTALMLAPCEDGPALAQVLADARKTVVVIGPGLGLEEPARVMVEVALRPSQGRSVVLDADALTHFAGRAVALGALVRAQGGAVVLTPHEGEFARLDIGLGPKPDSERQRVESVSQQADSKLERARRLTSVTGATVLLKGPDTVVASPDGRASISVDLPPQLASAGSGDVLAGMVGGLLAQGMPPFEAASAAVWLHGRAGDIAGRALTADDLPGAAAQAISEFR